MQILYLKNYKRNLLIILITIITILLSVLFVYSIFKNKPLIHNYKNFIAYSYPENLLFINATFFNNSSQQPSFKDATITNDFINLFNYSK